MEGLLSRRTNDAVHAAPRITNLLKERAVLVMWNASGLTEADCMAYLIRNTLNLTSNQYYVPSEHRVEQHEKKSSYADYLDCTKHLQ